MSGICFKQTFLHAEELYHISLKCTLYLIYVSKNFSLYWIYMFKVEVISGICLKQNFLSTEQLCHIAFKSY